MIVLLMVLTVVAVLALVAVLVFFLSRIIRVLESIGGEPIGYTWRSSYLGKIAFGVRAIETQTGHLGPEVTKLNAGLSAAAEGLKSIDGHLAATIEAVVRQEGN
ncbi:MAG: hypothetical protein K5924_08385 [Chloroflexi bacterium]|nr:hypothetical protein [Chloroflexota bacterium]